MTRLDPSLMLQMHSVSITRKQIMKNTRDATIITSGVKFRAIHLSYNSEPKVDMEMWHSLSWTLAGTAQAYWTQMRIIRLCLEQNNSETYRPGWLR